MFNARCTSCIWVQANAGLLLHPTVGLTKPGDIDASVRVRCYQAIVASGTYYPPDGVILSLLGYAFVAFQKRVALITPICVQRGHANGRAAGSAVARHCAQKPRYVTCSSLSSGQSHLDLYRSHALHCRP